MPFETKILDTLNCPRCNAIAQLRIESRRDDALIVYIVCSKCRLQKYHSTTTEKAVLLRKKERRLLSLLNDDISPAKRHELMGRLQKIRTQLSKAKPGMGG